MKLSLHKGIEYVLIDHNALLYTLIFCKLFHIIKPSVLFVGHKANDACLDKTSDQGLDCLLTEYSIKI